MLWRWAAPLLWAGFLFAASSVPGAQLPSGGIPHLDKALHAIAYALLAWLVARAGRATTRGALALAAAAAVLYGVSDELHQRFTPGRDADVWDLVADAVGAVAGVWLRARARGYRYLQTRAKP